MYVSPRFWKLVKYFDIKNLKVVGENQAEIRHLMWLLCWTTGGVSHDPVRRSGCPVRAGALCGQNMRTGSHSGNAEQKIYVLLFLFSYTLFYKTFPV